jgi:hypothetical protein
MECPMRSDVATAARHPARRRDDGHAVNTTLVVLELDGILIPLPSRSDGAVSFTTR